MSSILPPRLPECGHDLPVGYRLAWRRMGRKIDGSRMMIVESARARDTTCLLAIAMAKAEHALAGDLRVDMDEGPRVYTSLAQMRAWDLGAGTMPAAATQSIWAKEVRRANIVSEMLAMVRSAFVRAVAAGIVHESAATSIVRIAERAAADPDAILK